MPSSIDALKAVHPSVPDAVLLKSDLMFKGVRFTPALEKAAERDAHPGYWPHTLPPEKEGEKGRKVYVPYIFAWENGMTCRVKVDEAAPYVVEAAGDGHELFAIEPDGSRESLGAIGFVPRPKWFAQTLADGTPASHSGVSQHGDMLIVNVSPGCDYFKKKDEDGRSMRCTFCAYGRFDARTNALGQQPFVVDIPDGTLEKAAAALQEAAKEARQVYLVGGSMLDPADEAKRYLQLIEATRKAAPDVFLAAGSGAVDKAWSQAFKDAGADGAAYNLEVWDPDAFAVVSPGKNHFVGRDRWLKALEDAVDVFGEGNVITALVAGIELYPPSPLAGNAEAALKSALEGADWLIERGIQPVHSPFWPVPGTPYQGDQAIPQDYFLQLAVGAYESRKCHDKPTPTHFVDRRASYMQVEADMDYGMGFGPDTVDSGNEGISA